ncbi:MAG: DUF1385 domain-containing protein [Oscillospiraceae bacterium]|jgi:uncharacterized protein YqhQ
MAGKFKTIIGGQALIEGIYMRGPKKQSVVVNAPDGIKTKVEDIKLIKDRYPILGWPFIRGIVNFFDSMAKGVSALMYSANFFPEDENAKPSKMDEWIGRKFGDKADKLIIWVAVFLGVAFSVGLFFIVPTLIASLLRGLIGSRVISSLLEGLIRVAIFLGYLILCSRLSDMKRVFAYHGAEHKTIHCYEAGLSLNVENVRKQPRLHPRCGTSFLFTVIVISILIFMVITADNVILRVLLRLLLLPVVVGISYEINRLAGRYDNRLTRILTAPGMWFQHITTNEPDDDMIRVGIEALKLVIPEEEGADRW